MTLLAKSNKIMTSRELQIVISNAGIIICIASNCFDILGFTISEMLNTHINEYLDYSFDSTITNSRIQASAFKKNGQKLYLDIVAKPLTYSENKSVSLELSCFEINSYINFEKKYNSFLKMLENVKDIVFRYQLQPKPMFTYISPSAANIFGISVDEFYNYPFLAFNIVHPDDIEIHQSKIDKHSDFSKFFCVRFKHKNGTYVWIEDYIIPDFDANGELISVQGISRDITERKKSEQKLKELSYHDGLTGLYNRTYLNKQIEMLINHGNIPVAVITCDLDNLKYINDSFGHAKGDMLLNCVSRFFNTIFYKDSRVVRNGGDEFIILIYNTSLKEAEDMYSKMLSSIEEYNKTNKMPIPLSSGFSYSSSSNTILELLSQSDKNMYKNKYEKKKGLKY
ncbi:diguanylate cyclase [Clostridium tagluense]|uniref:diguanylate cyclase domain-containing protein n=1 Tax=Clostridium tagluense TaxID=360422 RepID=UPI001CF42A2D|nr:diguanylate cyclase [Clostridium tagluense]MCB2313924.1 diguanylate cyclase [Clostridium tagluense]MCB2318741.1 diguanylate cyclase [Clostridium tagluense]MCB2323591.1 diguanylate cyclase [Clostridium tagluense]MCB2328499.1 diguanylate cyclase [Clostridium tagluense]MCB2333352.1 diguanylate cyclase [Clostridium tagluense]